MRTFAASGQVRGVSARRFVGVALVFALVSAAGCSSSSVPVEKAEINEKTKFSSEEFGVKASPRVTVAKAVPKGGGSYRVGKPYKVRGKWYTPKEDPTYVATGKASWYGPNFHGRLTANGEIYNQYALSAAHPTMPLPSYARVTNLKNNTSVIVRVNDRGPFAHGRVIDLSGKAADLLDFKTAGIAEVKVEYVGKARLDGHDEKFLLASYRGPGMPQIEPGATQPGTMIALAPEPESPVGQETIVQAAFAVAAAIPVPTPRPADYGGGTPLLLAFADQPSRASPRIAPLSYAADPLSSRVADAFAAVDRETAAPRDYSASPDPDAASQTALVSLGVFVDDAAIDYVRKIFADLGVISARKAERGERQGWELTMLVGGDVADSVVDTARDRGLKDARRLAGGQR